MTSSLEVLQSIPEQLRESTKLSITLHPTEHGKALGLCWDTTSDSFLVTTPKLALDHPPTKRSVSSVIVRTFDIMRWQAPTLLPAKLLLQELWKLLGWNSYPRLPAGEM